MGITRTALAQCDRCETKLTVEDVRDPLYGNPDPDGWMRLAMIDRYANIPAIRKLLCGPCSDRVTYILNGGE